MQINIKQEYIEKTVNDIATEAVGGALRGHQVQQAIQAVITESFINDTFKYSLAEAIKSIDRDALNKSLANELGKACTRLAANILNEGLVDVVCKIRGIPTYDTDKRHAVCAEMLSKHGKD